MNFKQTLINIVTNRIFKVAIVILVLIGTFFLGAGIEVITIKGWKPSNNLISFPLTRDIGTLMYNQFGSLDFDNQAETDPKGNCGGDESNGAGSFSCEDTAVFPSNTQKDRKKRYERSVKFSETIAKAPTFEIKESDLNKSIPQKVIYKGKEISFLSMLIYNGKPIKNGKFDHYIVYLFGLYDYDKAGLKLYNGNNQSDTGGEFSCDTIDCKFPIDNKFGTQKIGIMVDEEIINAKETPREQLDDLDGNGVSDQSEINSMQSNITTPKASTYFEINASQLDQVIPQIISNEGKRIEFKTNLKKTKLGSYTLDILELPKSQKIAFIIDDTRQGKDGVWTGGVRYTYCDKEKSCNVFISEDAFNSQKIGFTIIKE